MEIARQALVARLGPAPGGGAQEPGLDRQVEDQGQVGPEIADGQLVELVEDPAIDAMAVALVGKR